MPRIKQGRIFADRINKNRESFGGSPKSWAGAVWVENESGCNERCWLLTAAEIKTLDARSEKNREDWTHKDFLTDLTA